MKNLLNIYPAMRQWLLTLLAGLCMISTYATTQTPQQLYNTATQQYKANNFGEAAKIYQQILAEGYKSADVFYNLGNCFYKLNNPGKAVLNYERALKLKPDDEDIIHNLKIVNLSLVDKIQPVPQLGIVTWWNNFTQQHSAKGWGIYAIVCIWLTLVAAIVYLFTGIKKPASYTGSLFLLLSVACISLAFKQNSSEQNPDAAVLMVDSTFVKSAPSDSGTNIFMIHQGTSFKLLDNVSTWYKIRLADGKTGWVERNNFEKI